MADAVTALAIIGAAALAVRLVFTLAKLLLESVRRTAAEELAGVSARRGDLSELADRQSDEAAARTGRRRHLLLALIYLLALALPAAFGLARPVYAAASVLWLLPGGPSRRRSRAVTP